MEAYKQIPMTTSSHEHQGSKSFPARRAQLALHQLPGRGRRSLIVLAGLIAIVCLCLSFSAPSLHAQGYGTISGTVADPSGAVVTGASVIAVEVQTGNQTRTVSGKDGRFVFPTLLPSSYTLSVTAAGFESYTQTGIVLEADQALTVNLTLKIGAQTQTVSVSAEAPQVDTTTGTLSQVIDMASVQRYAAERQSRSNTDYAGCRCRRCHQRGQRRQSGQRKDVFSVQLAVVQVASVNGTLPNQDNFLLDGGNNLDEMTNVNDPYPMPDALQEFSVQTSNYDAEFGQSAGAVVNIVTRSGGEAFHGDLFEYLRNGFFNAENHFSPAGQPGYPAPPSIRRHHRRTGEDSAHLQRQDHAVLLRLSVHPHPLRFRGGTFTSPTAAEEGTTGTGYADFSNLCTSGFNGSGICNSASQQISNPYTGVAWPNNHIPTSAMDPACDQASLLISPRRPRIRQRERPATWSTISPPRRTISMKIRRASITEFGANDHMFARYFYDWFQQPGIYNPTNLALGGLESYSSYFQTRYQNALISETHTFTPNLLNNLVLNFQREVSQRGGPPGSFDITQLAPEQSPRQHLAADVGPYLALSISNYMKVGSSASAVFERNNYTLNDDLHWVKGQHNFAFGGHVELSKFDVVNVYNSYGAFTSGLAGTSLPAANVNTMANFELGFLSALTQGEFELTNDRNNFPGLYAQDSWKINHRLTLDYGVRWEDFAPWHNKIGVQTAFSATEYAANKGTPQFAVATTSGTPGLPAGMVLSGDPGFPANGVNSQYNKFMPRIGFAYDVFGNGKTAMRGGYGIFFQDRMSGFFNLSQSTFAPNTITVALANMDQSNGSPGGPLSNPYCTGCTAGSYANPFPFTLPFKSSQVFPNQMEVNEYDPSGNLPRARHLRLQLDHRAAIALEFRHARRLCRLRIAPLVCQS